METPISSAPGDANSPRASFAGGGPSEGDGSTANGRSYYDKFGYPDAASHFEAKDQETLTKYMIHVSPILQPVLAKDRVAKFENLCCGWSHFMGRRDFIFPDVLISIISQNAVRCAKVALSGDLYNGRRADPNARHRYGFTPLHAAAETFSVDMVKLLLRHGASANIRTEGDNVIEGLLPLHVAVENAGMHKFLEDHWEDGCPLEKLISLLCLPEMKMYLDTTRLIAKHTDNIVDEVWNYINGRKFVELAILLLAAQKQLRGPVNGGRSKASRDGFDVVRRRTYQAIGSLHRQATAMVNEGKNGSVLKKLKNKKEDLITAGTLVDIVDNAGEALESYIQTYSEVTHEEIIEHVSSILNSNGIVHSGMGIDTGNLKGYQYLWATAIHKSVSRVDAEEPDKAENSSSLNAKVINKVPPKGLALRDERNKFFPYWKSVLSARLMVNIVPPCEPSMKDKKAMQGTEPGRKGVQVTNKSRGNLTSAPQLGSRYECRRQLCTIVLRSLKVVRRT